MGKPRSPLRVWGKVTKGQEHSWQGLEGFIPLFFFFFSLVTLQGLQDLSFQSGIRPGPRPWMCLVLTTGLPGSPPLDLE